MRRSKNFVQLQVSMHIFDDIALALVRAYASTTLAQWMVRAGVVGVEDETQARNLLEVCVGNLEMAINMHMENGLPQQSENSASTRLK